MPTDVAPLPGARNSHITFGCFNNTAKLNAGVFDLWARILISVPDSRLVLKWRTLADEPLCETIRAAFLQRGVDPRRLEVTRNLEDTQIALYRDIEQRENKAKILLNVGAGHPKS